MSVWPSSKTRAVLAALERMGCTEKRTTGSHRLLVRAEWPDDVFAFHDRDEVSAKMLATRRRGSLGVCAAEHARRSFPVL